MQNETGSREPVPIAVLVSITLVLLALCIARNSVWGNGITLWSDAALKSPLKGRPHNELGIAYAKNNMLDRAIEELELSYRLNKPIALIRTNLGNAYLLTGRNDNAIRMYNEALALSPNDAKAHYNLGLAYYNAGNMSMAGNEFEAAVNLNPGYELAKNMLARLAK